MTPGELAVLLRRLDELKAAIDARSWDDVEREYDRVLSAAQRGAGTRERPYDALRVGGFKRDMDANSGRVRC
jgi:hypothetical protein